MTRIGVMLPRDLPAEQVLTQVSDGLLLAEPATPSYIAASIARLASPASQVITYDAAVIADDGRAARDLVRPALARATGVVLVPTGPDRLTALTNLAAALR